MTRIVALRASVPFILAAALAAMLGVASQARAAEVLFAVAAALASVLLFFVGTARGTPALRTVPVRARPRRRG